MIKSIAAWREQICHRAVDLRPQALRQVRSARLASVRVCGVPLGQRSTDDAIRLTIAYPEQLAWRSTGCRPGKEVR
ncbi:MAG: hypothetical protein HGA19_03255 [Oscillochloris sp.]|nr:hypothetical protein [Oscillochloris sp.]